MMIAAAITCAGMVLVLMLFRKLGSPAGSLPLTADWIDELSIERYKPMMRLLDGEDIEFLRSQTGFTRSMAADLRARHCTVFRGFLDLLTADFNRVNTALRILMLHSERDRPELAAVLISQQLTFTCALAMVHVRLFLYRWGICKVDVTSLVAIFDQMRLELQGMVPMALTMSA